MKNLPIQIKQLHATIEAPFSNESFLGFLKSNAIAPCCCVYLTSAPEEAPKEHHLPSRRQTSE